MFGYPIEIKQWVCSDGQIVNSKEEAERIERWLDEERKNPTSFCASSDKAYDAKF